MVGYLHRVRAFVRTCMHTCTRARAHARACMRACLPACMRGRCWLLLPLVAAAAAAGAVWWCLLAAGCWLLASCCLLMLAAGCWLMAAGCRCCVLLSGSTTSAIHDKPLVTKDARCRFLSDSASLARVPVWHHDLPQLGFRTPTPGSQWLWCVLKLPTAGQAYDAPTSRRPWGELSQFLGATSQWLFGISPPAAAAANALAPVTLTAMSCPPNDGFARPPRWERPFQLSQTMSPWLWR